MNPRPALLPSLAVTLAAATWGCWWIPLRAIERNGLSSNLSPVALYGMATLILLAIAALRWRTLRAAGLPALIGLGFVYGSQLTIWSYAIIIGDVVRVTLLFYLAAAIGATILTDEAFGWREFGGCVLIVGAGLASSIDQIRQERVAPLTA